MKERADISVHSQLEASAAMLEQLMEHDESIVVMTADLAGSCKLKKIEERFPERFINVGIAEQNMVSIAAGLAHEGFKPFVYTFSVFASLRACEQVRTDVFYNRMNVKIVGTHCGVSTGQAGPTHFSLEDIGVIAAMPESIMIAPADATAAKKYIELLASTDKPAYLRLDRNVLPDIYGDEYEATIGKGRILTKGSKVAVLAIGAAVAEALVAQKSLIRREGREVTVVDMQTVKPIDIELLKQLAKEHSIFVTVEEHNVYGGLGSAVGLAIAELGLKIKLECIGIPDCYPQGNPVGYNRSRYGLDSSSIENAVKKLLKGKRKGGAGEYDESCIDE